MSVGIRINNQEERTRVMIVSDISLYRFGIERVVGESTQLVLVGSAATREKALQLAQIQRPNIVLVDFAMFESLATIAQLVAALPSLRVIVLTIPESESAVFSCVNACAVAYVTRRGSLEDLVDQIRQVSSGTAARGCCQAAETRNVTCTTTNIDQLTAKEYRVLQLVEEGLANKEIAREIVVELSTVKNHVHNIFQKLGVHTRTHAARILRTSAQHSEKGSRSAN